MEMGSIERELQVAASPDVVYEVISSAEHLSEWWPDHAELDHAAIGGRGRLTFGDPGSPDAKSERFLVVEAEPPKRFAFRWVIEPDEDATDLNSLLVTFELVPAADGTLVRFSESGFRERGWEAAVLEQAYRDHVQGWDHFLPRLVSHAVSLQVRS